VIDNQIPTSRRKLEKPYFGVPWQGLMDKEDKQIDG
jgi:hypothetical protein